MAEYRELYQQLIIDHGRHPRNFKVLDKLTHEKEGYNPLCGDQITLYLLLKDNVIEDIAFKGCGCAISLASTSLMTEALKGHTISYANELFELFHEMILESKDVPSNQQDQLGKLMVMQGVTDYPSRIKCATLAWHTMHALINEQTGKVSTE